MVISKPDDRESILKEQILGLIDRLMIKPFERYVVLIEDAQLMNAAAQNKLLKTLEEPVSDAVMILLSDGAEGLLPTVLSRCVRFYLDDDQSEASEADTAGRFVYSILTKAPYYKKRDALSDIIADKDSSRQRAEAFLDCTEELLLKVIKERRFSGRAVSDATWETLIPAAEEVPTDMALTSRKRVDATLLAAIARAVIWPRIAFCIAVFSPHSELIRKTGTITL